MSISKAIKNKDTNLLSETVAKAMKVYNASKPAEPTVPDMEGIEVPFSMVWDNKTKWQLVRSEYSKIANAMANLPKAVDRKVEEAKLIAANPYFRHMSTKAKTEGLL